MRRGENASERSDMLPGHVKSARTLPLVLLVAGVVWTAYLQTTIREGVFYSGDSGIKALTVKQFAAGGWHADLRLEAEPWVREIWDQGFYPFGPPFVYGQYGRYVSAFPLPFAALSVPFYEAFGERGLRILPLLCVWLLWVRFFYLGRRLEIEPPALSIGLFALIFSSHLTLYSAMFWEYTPAVALAFCGIAESVELRGPHRSRLRLGLGGLLLGSSAWLRPECAVLGAVSVVAFLPEARRRGLVDGWLLYAAGVGLALIGFGVFNQLAYGYPLGIHALQVVDQTTPAGRLSEAVRFGASIAGDLVVFAPLAAATFLGATELTFAPLRGRGPALRLLGIAAVTLVGTALIVPNTGGKQWGPRYALPVLPLLCLAASIYAERIARWTSRSWRLPAATAAGALLLYGAWLDTWVGSRSMAFDYEQRVLPALELLRDSEIDVVVVPIQWQAQELQDAFESKRFFWVENLGELSQLASELYRRGRTRFLWLESPSAQEPRTVEATLPSGLTLHKELIGARGYYIAYVCTLRRA